MKKVFRWCQFLVISCLLFGGLSSCGSDEPEGESIDYYMEVEEEFLVNGATNYTDRYKEHNPRTMMMDWHDVSGNVGEFFQEFFYKTGQGIVIDVLLVDPLVFSG